MYRPQQHGITALELLVTMAIAAILLATAVPSFKNYSWNLRMRAAMDVLQTDLNLARSRAISHNIQTIICPATDSSDCSGESSWQQGWIVFADLNGDRHKQEGEPLLKHAGAIELLTINSSRSRNHLRFFPNGTAPGSNISILFCDRRGTEKAAVIAVSNSGRIRQQTDSLKTNANCP
ncbi:MAG: prepilin-type N-terminal cleavage/methylation domain-containing protein [Gammaproteobacteria bacterium]|nr:prepilin-type N-terminal cleavage/methylation domain-containing protein [Gammaproteobacteria bacterium]